MAVQPLLEPCPSQEAHSASGQPTPLSNGSALLGDNSRWRFTFLSHTTQPSLNQIPGRKVISPAPLCCFPTKSRDSHRFIGDVTRPVGTCFSLHCLKLGRHGELMFQPACKSCRKARCRNLPLAWGSVAMWIPLRNGLDSPLRWLLEKIHKVSRTLLKHKPARSI